MPQPVLDGLEVVQRSEGHACVGAGGSDLCSVRTDPHAEQHVTRRLDGIDLLAVERPDAEGSARGHDDALAIRGEGDVASSLRPRLQERRAGGEALGVPDAGRTVDGDRGDGGAVGTRRHAHYLGLVGA